MKHCPQCSTAYEDDLMFCLLDGNALLDSDGEQETVLNQRFTMPAKPESGEAPVFCPDCGYENRAKSKFCKKCGMDVTASAGPDRQPAQTVFGFGNMGSPDQAADFQRPGETVTFRPPTFPDQPAGGQGNSSSKLVVIALAVVAGVLLSVVVVVLLMGGSDKPAVNSDTIKKVNSNDESKTRSVLPQTFERTYSGTIGGKQMTMVLKRDGSKLTGSVTTTKADTLEGTIQDDGQFSADGFEDDTVRTGMYSGRIGDDGTVNGNWTTPEGTKGRALFGREQ